MLINLTIDGREISVENGTSIMEAARLNDIYIPGFCFHPKLDSFGACRVCIVHVTERGRTKDKFACAQPVSEGMEVETKSEKINKYVKSVTEYLLVHHPLDCPVCDKSGECELQDVTFKFGLSKNRMSSCRRNEPSVRDNPVLEFNHNRCILCGRCTRICEEVQGIAAIDFQKRGFNTIVGTSLEQALDCEFCGQCLSVCPVGAIQDRVFNFNARPWELKKTQTTCTYCSVGCTLYLNEKDQKVLRVTSEDEVGVNNGNLCSKGRFGFEFIHSGDRVTQPMIKKDGKLIPSTWDDALGLVSSKLKDVMKNKGPDAIGGLGSEKSTNEENYLFQKFFRAVIGTNNIDNMANMHAPYLNNLILEACDNDIISESYDDISNSDLIFIIGSDVKDELPVAGNIIRKAIKKNKSSLIIANSRRVEFRSVATKDKRIVYSYGREIDLINAVVKYLLDENLVDAANVSNNVDEFNNFKESLDSLDLDNLLNKVNISKEDLADICDSLIKSKNKSLFIGKDLINGGNGNGNIRTILNLAYTLKYGLAKDNDEVGYVKITFPREHNNSQGVNDMGVIPDCLPGYQNLNNKQTKEKIEKIWSGNNGTNYCISDKTSRDKNIIELAAKGDINLLYVMGDNPLLSYSDGLEVREAINNLDFLIVQDSFLTETAFMADVVLPAVTFAEKEGSFTNINRGVQKVNKSIESVELSKDDGLIIIELAKNMGHNIGFDNIDSLMNEINEVCPSYSLVNYKTLSEESLVYTSNVNNKVSATFSFNESLESSKKEKENYPFALTTGNVMYHLGTYSYKSRVLKEILPDCLAEINPLDAKEYNIKNNEVIEIVSPNGELRLKAKITNRSPRGVIFIPTNVNDVPVNLLTTKNGIGRVKILKVIS